jgi:RNA recognition motif-containing protein
MYHQQQQQQHQGFRQNNNYQSNKIPNRIYVGGIPQDASQDELRDYFSTFGLVKDARIITDQIGNSRGFGFVTFEQNEDASKVLALRDNDLTFKESKLNINQAYRNNNNQQGGQNGGGFRQHHQGGHHQGGFGGHQQHQQHHQGGFNSYNNHGGFGMGYGQ